MLCDDEFYVPPIRTEKLDHDVLGSLSMSTGNVSDKHTLDSEKSFISYRAYETHDEQQEDNPRYYCMLDLIKYLKSTDPTGTACVLSQMLEFDLRIDQFIYAIEDANAVEILINLLEVDIFSCQLGAIKVINEVTKLPQITKLALSMGLCETLVKLFNNAEEELVCLALKAIVNITYDTYGKVCVRKNNAIPYLVMFADADRELLSVKLEMLPSLLHREAIKSLDSLKAIKNISKTRKGRQELFESGTSCVLYDLLNSQEPLFLKTALHIFINCVKNDLFKHEFDHLNVFNDMVQIFHLNKPCITMLAAKYVWSVCDHDNIQEQMVTTGLLPAFLNYMTVETMKSDYKLYKIISKILYKIHNKEIILIEFHKRDVIHQLYHLIKYQKCSEIEKGLWGILSELATFRNNWLKIWNLPEIEETLIYNLTNHQLDEVKGFSAKIIGYLINIEQIFVRLEFRGIFLKLWGLLNMKLPSVFESVGFALLQFMTRMEHLPNVIRNIRHGMETILNLLKSKVPEILSLAIMIVSKIIEDPENIETMTSLGALEKITNLFNSTEDQKIRKAVCYVIGALAMHPKYAFQFGREGNIPRLINDARSNDMELRVPAVHAMWKLSEDPINCIILYSHGATKLLLPYLIHDNDKLRLAAGSCLYNIRNLAYNAERKKWLYFNEPLPPEDECKMREAGICEIYFIVRE